MDTGNGGKRLLGVHLLDSNQISVHVSEAIMRLDERSGITEVNEGEGLSVVMPPDVAEAVALEIARLAEIARARIEAEDAMARLDMRVPADGEGNA